jgi:hypothetical protein
MDAMMARLAKLEEDTGSVVIDKKARNTDPKQFSFAIWDGKPVLGYKAGKKDNTRDLYYKTPA